MKIKKITIFTSIRSEYGLLKSLIRQIDIDPYLELNLLVGGAHLLEEYGNTIEEIENDGFNISYKLPFLFNDNLRDVNTRSIAILAHQISEYFNNNEVDLLIILGDRFELLPIVTAALVLNIPIGHISGGEITEGSIDNQVRHAISKIAHLHFTATKQFKNNLIQIGEESWRIKVCGELGLDEIVKLNIIPKKILFDDLKLVHDRPVICVTFHSETINNRITGDFITKLFEEIIAKTKYQILVTAANFDNGGKEINNSISLLSERYDRIVFCKSLGKLRYFSLLKYSNLVLGNSSSGLVEVQSFNIPVVNVGKRQQGRLANPNVYDVDVKVEEIIEAIFIVTSPNFIKKFINKQNLYGKGNSAQSIVNFIKDVDKGKLLFKRTNFKN